MVIHSEQDFFEKVKKALKSQEVYDNFLRYVISNFVKFYPQFQNSPLLFIFRFCFTVFMTKGRALLTHPQLLRCIVLYNEETLSPSDIVHIVVHFIGKFPELFAWFKNSVGYKDATPTDQGRKNRMGELEINYASCKRYGASYRAHPANYVPPRCMGRTDLCKQVHH
jgi:histone deacetylase complex regulatory component SIN3